MNLHDNLRKLIEAGAFGWHPRPGMEPAISAFFRSAQHLRKERAAARSRMQPPPGPSGRCGGQVFAISHPRDISPCAQRLTAFVVGPSTKVRDRFAVGLATHKTDGIKPSAHANSIGRRFAWLGRKCLRPFFKVVCKVTPGEFENAKLVKDHMVLIESALGNQEVAIVFKPREKWPKLFKFLELYREFPDLT